MIKVLPQIHQTAVVAVDCRSQQFCPFSHAFAYIAYICDSYREQSKTNGLQNKFSFKRKIKKAYFFVLGLSF